MVNKEHPFEHSRIRKLTAWLDRIFAGQAFFWFYDWSTFKHDD